MERNNRKTFIGRVTSTKMNKTISVVVESKKDHPIYKKQIKVTKSYKAHDENNEAQVGDLVEIMETRPLSATKRARLVRIIEKAVN